MNAFESSHTHELTASLNGVNHSTPKENRMKKDPFSFAPNHEPNPRKWSTKRKCFITGIAILLVMNATFASSAPSGAFNSTSVDLGVSVEATGLVTTVFLLGYCAGPFIWAPLSEFYGRRYVFLISFVAYFGFTFLCAFTPNFAGLIVGRFLTGTFASAALSNSPGVLADLWDTNARGNAMIVFSLATFVEPALGPVASGFLGLKKTWRWTYYILLWLAGLTLVLLMAIPETLSSKLQNTASSPETTQRTLSSLFLAALSRPWRILFDPISFLIAIYYSVVYTLLYMLFSIYPIVFRQKRGWNAGVAELPLVGVVLGACVGGILLYLFNSRQQQRRLNRAPQAEDRLPATMVGGVLFAVTMFWFAWTAEFDSIHWIVPTLAGAFLATSILLIFVGFINYLLDTYLAFAASAIAANTVVRSACGATAPLFTQYMFDALGVGGGGPLIAGVAVILTPIPFVFYRYGEVIRRKSSSAPTVGMVIQGQNELKV